jgi:cytochrome c2
LVARLKTTGTNRGDRDVKKQMTMFFGTAALILSTSVATTSLAADGQVSEGKTFFNDVCGTCHTNKPNQNRIGPSLFGVIGRHAGSAPGFDYSTAMKGAPVTWTADTLDRYLADPKAVVPGNKMPYAGVKNDERRKNLIAYLSTLTQ